MTTHSLLILPGDGIGPEVMTEVRKVIGWFQTNKGIQSGASTRSAARPRWTAWRPPRWRRCRWGPRADEATRWR